MAIKATRDLLPLKVDLHAAWDLRLYNFGGGDVQDRGGQDEKFGVKLTIVMEKKGEERKGKERR